MGPESRVPITGIALDGHLDLDAPQVELIWPEVRRYAYGRVYEAPGGGRLYVFSFGAIVRDGRDTVERPLIDEVTRAFGRRVLPATLETYYVSINPEWEGRSPRVGWDHVMIPSRSGELIAAVALLLGQSVALERYEAAGEQLGEEAWQTARHLIDRGRPPWSSSTLLKRIGRLTRDRLELANLFYLIDRPEETWEDPKVEALYDALFANLELGQRHRALLQKLDSVESGTGQVIGIWHGMISNRLEWAIVVLIVVEIVLAVLGKL